MPKSYRNPQVPKRTADPKTRAPKQAKPSPAPSQPKPKPTAKDPRYVVKRGDSLSTIAKKQGTTLAKILKLNPNLTKNPKYNGGNRIFSGTKVRLK